MDDRTRGLSGRCTKDVNGVIMSRRIIYTIILALILVPASGIANTFINWVGEYYISYPDDWYLVSHPVVAEFLATQGVTREEFNYQAVLAKRIEGKTEPDFIYGPYIFVTHQAIGPATEQRIDSVILYTEGTYDKDALYESLGDGTAVLGFETPIYDEEYKMLVVKTRISSEFMDKYLLEIKRFYENGVALFLCYAPKEIYNDAQPDFIQIAQSMSTENIDEVGRDSLNQGTGTFEDAASEANADLPEPGQEGKMSDSTRIIIYILIIVVILILIYILFIKKKR